MENNEDVQVTEETVEKETTQKKYTVEDVNNSYKAGVKKARAELEESESYKKYQDWVKSNQNDSERIKELEGIIANKDNEISQYKIKEQNSLLEKSEVKEEFIEFVKSEVIKNIDDTTDFETALENYKKEKPQFFGEKVIKKVQSSPVMAGGTQPKTTNDIMNSFIRNK